MLTLRGRMAGVTPALTQQRARKLDEMCRDYGEETVRLAPRGMRYSQWHNGAKDGVLRIAPENVFHVTGKINQVELLADLARRHAAGETATSTPTGPLPAGYSASHAAEALELDAQMRGMGA